MTEMPLLSAEEASRVRSSLLDLRQHWQLRPPGESFFTLGTASYLDARTHGFDGYLARVGQSNALLRESFGWLYDRLRQVFASHVDAEVCYDTRLALPGFHIFLVDPTAGPRPASVHFDMQYELIDWAALGTPDIAAQKSLTLPIRLPATGGGLLVWDINRLDLDRMSADERLTHSKANRDATRHPYTVGRIVIHSGHQLHQIASTPNLAVGDERITLQAHALPVDDRWVLYW